MPTTARRCSASLTAIFVAGVLLLVLLRPDPRPPGRPHHLCAVPLPPATNPLGVPNRVWEWRGQQIRYQALGEQGSGPSVLLVHGLFVNADHWRRNLPALAEAGFRVFAVDLLGYGYSSKPEPCGEEASRINGERDRDLSEPEVELGTSDGGRRTTSVPQAHPLGSVYNFFTWSEQIVEFAKEVMGTDSMTLVSNSIGSISSLQAAVDHPDLVKGVLIINPNFRELHVAEQPALLKPVTSFVQSMLRENGKPLYTALAKPDTVKQILKEPYADTDQVTDELVSVLLDPLLLDGAAEVIFDGLSYSAGPLPEQLLQDPKLKAPVWVCWGEEDPWTPNRRVKALERFDPVKKVMGLAGIGHCPHDEAPQVVNPIIVDFVRQVSTSSQASAY